MTPDEAGIIMPGEAAGIIAGDAAGMAMPDDIGAGDTSVDCAWVGVEEMIEIAAAQAAAIDRDA
ncbi:MAG: hypothetical protein IAI48_06655 [Candidatus Eremiobacteraeota bacterium]|nr:hypothetical protein [Candidatus Eremiobacteraeota bacterium]